jgi:putative membrane protein insertion efficiency factor
MKQLSLILIDAYRLVLSPFFGGQCRYAPSCSAYTREAIERYGTIKGISLGIKRLLRCHPFHRGGFDPVP